MNEPSPSTGQRVLLVEDDRVLARTVEISLRTSGYRVDVAYDATTAISLFAANGPDAVLLDLGLPDADGLEVLSAIRAVGNAPVVVVTARHGDTEAVSALDHGADDFVTKPFSTPELLARLRAVLRRTIVSTDEPAVLTDAFRLDLSAKSASASGQVVRLTPIEWKIVEVLVQSPSRLVTQRELLTKVWGPSWLDDSGYLRVHLGHIRRKLEPSPARPRYFITEPGIGYRFEP